MNGNRQPNDGRLAIIEVLSGQDFGLPSGERHSVQHEIEDQHDFEKLLHGVYARAGVV